MKLALDTDVLVAAVRSRRGASRAWIGAILREEATLLLSVPLALQYEAVLTRPEQLAAAGATVEQITALLDALCAVCKPVESRSCGARCCATRTTRWCSRQP